MSQNIDLSKMEASDFADVGLNKLLGMEFLEAGHDKVVAQMPITADKFQPWGVLHGGATLALLEAVASRASEFWIDPATERVFGIDVHVRHWKPGKSGMLRGVAEIDHEEGSKQFWTVTALDDEGDVVSKGTIITKKVSLARLAEKEAKRAAERA